MLGSQALPRPTASGDTTSASARALKLGSSVSKAELTSTAAAPQATSARSSAAYDSSRATTRGLAAARLGAPDSSSLPSSSPLVSGRSSDEEGALEAAMRKPRRGRPHTAGHG